MIAYNRLTEDGHGSPSSLSVSDYGSTPSRVRENEPSADAVSGIDLSLSNHAQSELNPTEQVPVPEGEAPDWPLIALGAVLGTLIIGGGVAAAGGWVNFDTFVHLAKWFETLGPSAIFLYAGLYFVLELIAVPALPLTLGSGYLFGMVKGTMAVSVSSTLAAVAAFLIARYGLRGMISNVAVKYPRFIAMDRIIARQGFKFVLLLRLSPLLPFSISNYLYGITSVDLLQYSIASWLGMLPGTIAYVSAGAAVGALSDLSNGVPTQVNAWLLAIGVLATVAVLVTFGRVAAQVVTSAEDEAIDEEEGVRRI